MTEKKTKAGQLKPPTAAELRAALGDVAEVWSAIVSAVEEKLSPLDKRWQLSKASFGRVCLLQHKKRTLLYMTPGEKEILIAIVLGERAAAIAATSSLPVRIKKLIAEARPYAEGRGIRFAVRSSRDVAMISKLVGIKTTPK